MSPPHPVLAGAIRTGVSLVVFTKQHSKVFIWNVVVGLREGRGGEKRRREERGGEGRRTTETYVRT